MHAAREGDQDAWNALIARYTGLVWSIARTYRLTGVDAADVVQTTWLRLIEHLDRLHNPSAVGTWLATTARHESVRVLRRRGRAVPTDDEVRLEPRSSDVDVDGPDARLLREERDDALWTAFRQLPEACQQLLRVLFTDPVPTYEEVSAATGMPVGSIGPTRARCLRRLRTLLERAMASNGVGVSNGHGTGDTRDHSES